MSAAVCERCRGPRFTLSGGDTLCSICRRIIEVKYAHPGCLRVTNAALRAEVARVDEHYQRTGELDRILFAALLRELDIRGAAYPDEIGGRA